MAQGSGVRKEVVQALQKSSQFRNLAIIDLLIRIDHRVNPAARAAFHTISVDNMKKTPVGQRYDVTSNEIEEGASAVGRRAVRRAQTR